jgi:sugar-specific transcriptional regulator TrmB
VVGNTSNGPTTADVARRLQQLGLKEYEAKCFVALTTLSSGTAREISKAVDVPRTRVYEAARALESHGLIDVQHSSPQQFRAVPIEEAVSILRRRYDSRIDKLETELTKLETTTTDEEETDDPEIWALSGQNAITTRTNQLLENADDRAVIVVTDDRVLSSPLCEWLQGAQESGCAVAAGAVVESVKRRLDETLSDITVFDSELGWLHPDQFEDSPPVSFLLAVDKKTVLVSASSLTTTDPNQHAIYGTGVRNSIVVLLRTLASRGLDDEQ